MGNKENPISDFERLASNVEDSNKVLTDNKQTNTLNDNVVNQKNVQESDASGIIIEEDNNSNQQFNPQVNLNNNVSNQNTSLNNQVVGNASNNPSVVQNNQVTNNNVNNQNGVQTNQVNVSSKTIGTIKPDKQKSPIAMVVLFGVLIVFILFMPQIIELSNKYLGTNLNANNGEVIREVTQNQQNNEEVQEIKIYPLDSSSVIALDTVSFTDFQKSGEENNYYLSFNVKNNSVNAYTIEKKLYLDYLDNSNTLIGRSYIETLKSVSSNATNNYKIEISNEIYNNATNVELVLRTDDDYPNINLSMNQLTCDRTRNNEKDTLIYNFTNSRLTSIKDMYEYIRATDVDDYTYNSTLLSYQERISNLNSLDGVSGVITESSNGFMASVSIEYQNADYTKLSSNTNYYINETYARIIAFEMGAKGYNCR